MSRVLYPVRLQLTSLTTHALPAGSDEALCGRRKRPARGGGFWFASRNEVTCHRCRWQLRMRGTA